MSFVTRASHLKIPSNDPRMVKSKNSKSPKNCVKAFQETLAPERAACRLKDRPSLVSSTRTPAVLVSSKVEQEDRKEKQKTHRANARIRDVVTRNERYIKFNRENDLNLSYAEIIQSS